MIIFEGRRVIKPTSKVAQMVHWSLIINSFLFPSQGFEPSLNGVTKSLSIALSD